MSRHVDAETLAAFREELLSRRKAARVSAHLAACSRCAGLDAQLAGVPALLSGSTAPPMPDALTARIEAAIAAEAAARAATTADGAVAVGTGGAQDGTARPAAQRTGRAARPPGRPRRSVLALRVAAVTAAVVVVAGGGYGVAKLLSGSPGKGSAAAEGAPAARPAAPSMSGNVEGPASGGSAASGSSGAGRTAPAARIISSGINYQPGQLKAQVSAVLAQHRANVTEGPGPSPAGRHASAARQLPACVAPATGGARPLLIDHASYGGRPATVIVVPAGAGTVRALVVAGDCTATAAHVLATATIPAPG